jgi:hypothetical protein
MTDQTNELFAAALGVAAPWFVARVDFDNEQRQPSIRVDLVRGSRFGRPKPAGELKVGERHVISLRLETWRADG